MTSAEWAILVPAIAGVLAGVTAWLKAQSAHKAIRAHKATPHSGP